ncbi:hypothetical protein ACFL1T_04305 [Chlamydiota bacterium]
MQKIDEKIDVLASFIGGKITVIRFRWKNTAFIVNKTTGKWTKRDGPYPIYYFSVCCNKQDVYELSFNSRTLSWKIIALSIE